MGNNATHTDNKETSNEKSNTAVDAQKKLIGSSNHENIAATDEFHVESNQSMINFQNTYINSTIKNEQILSTSTGEKCIDGLNFNVPANPEHEIVGRDEDAHEVFNLIKDETIQVRRNRVVITGVGGIGKTTLAALCAKKWCINTNPRVQNVAFLNAENEQSFSTSVQGLAIVLGIDKSLQSSEIFKKVAELYKEKSLLLILDNLEELKVVKCVLSLPSNIYILGTSQNRAFGKHFNEYQLQFLHENESEMLVNTIFGDDFINLPKSDGLMSLLQILIDNLAGLPISLAHAASYIREEVDDLCIFGNALRNSELYEKTLKKYLSDFDEKLKEPFPDQFVTINSKSAFTAIKINVEKLLHQKIASKQANITAEILKIISHLGPENISRNMFLVLFNEDDFQLAMVNLKKNSLITETSYNNNVYLYVHSITQNVVRFILNDVHWQDKVALYSLFNNHNEHRIDKLEAIKLNKADIEDIIERAYSFFKSNVEDSLIILQKAGCNFDNLDWSFAQKLLLSSCKYFNVSWMISVLQIIDGLMTKNENQLTTMHLALTKTVDKNFVRFLIQQGLSTNAVTKDKVSPFQIAFIFAPDINFNYNDSALDILIDSSNVNTKNFNGDTVLHNIALGIWFSPNYDTLNEVLQYLIEIGATFDIENNDGDAPIHTSVRHYNIMQFNLFHKYGADINLQNSKGETALHIAVRATVNFEDRQAPIFVKTLQLTAIMNRDPRIDIADKNGESVIDVALASGQKYLSEWLQQYKDLPEGLTWDHKENLFIPASKDSFESKLFNDHCCIYS